MKLYTIHIGDDVYEQEGDEHLIYEEKIIIFKDKNALPGSTSIKISIISYVLFSEIRLMHYIYYANFESTSFFF